MKVGSLVELIGNFKIYHPLVKYPVKNKVYTVRGFHPFDDDGLYLEEIDNSSLSFMTQGGLETSFNIKKFRELLPPMKIDIKEFIKELS